MSGWAAVRVDRGARGAIARRPLSAIIGARCARGWQHGCAIAIAIGARRPLARPRSPMTR
ncbi:hypothetical protein EGT65_22005 [Burkholderia mallei]|uniref:Uncharacterized protein n=1 Tax=Burkholderia mallei TaxID=13373 RepID=A0AAX1X0Q6_BURML|nr:hypothetical protein D8O03_02400 [Burkholderia mallei]RPA13661.1 hypothetical protein EGT61_015860 [Burkholderia mallei]RPA23934.1 hypothetical protein EGT70_11990 [Burkholderia mallei]RPA44625.1 hypothetical protein EGT65_22005 [Burkholderia mallei]RPA51532.1 hypothetical protein EGT66_00830 [Burkholderia mallei]